MHHLHSVSERERGGKQREENEKETKKERVMEKMENKKRKRQDKRGKMLNTFFALNPLINGSRGRRGISTL